VLAEDVHDGVATLTLARAERGNALSPELVDALLAAVARHCGAADVHTLALAGDGRHFCTGFDLSDLDACSDGDLLARFVRIEALLAALWHAPVRTVAAARGRAWGAGADLFAACDLRIAAPDASFRFPGAGFGLVLGTRRLAERVGADRARHWVIDGATVNAAQALDAGLANRLADADDGLAGDAADPAPRTPLADTDPLAQAVAHATRAPAITRATAAAIRHATRADHRDADLAALVRSAAEPGLKARIAAYRDAVRRAPR